MSEKERPEQGARAKTELVGFLPSGARKRAGGADRSLKRARGCV